MPILNRKLRNYKELGWPEATEVEKKVEWEEYLKEEAEINSQLGREEAPEEAGSR
jgi:hypothetical protein